MEQKLTKIIEFISQVVVRFPKFILVRLLDYWNISIYKFSIKKNILKRNENKCL